MPASSPTKERRAEPPAARQNQLESAFKFFRQWLREPRSIAALAPSGRQLAGHMAAAIGRNAHAVVELGGGTGVMTQALLERGISPRQLLVIELNPELHAHLEERFPEVEVALASAVDLADVVRASPRLSAGKIDAVASSLGLLTMTRDEQRRVLAGAFEVLRPGGRFVQFTYAPRCPVPRELRVELGLEERRVSWSLRNLPPAFVYVLRRKRLPGAVAAPP